MTELKKGEFYGYEVAADSRRKEFDIKNESLLANEIRPDFVFIGDSITHYWELSAYFGGTGERLVNRGIGGDVTEYVKRRLFVDVIQLEPRYCVLAVGTNDSALMEADLQHYRSEKSKEEVLAKAKENFTNMFEQMEQTGIQLIVSSILPIRHASAVHLEERMWYIRSINAWLCEQAEKRGFIYVDYYSHFVKPGTDEQKEGVTVDRLHPNARGYRIMADCLRKTLAANNIII